MNARRSGTRTPALGGDPAPLLVPDAAAGRLCVVDCVARALPYMTLARCFRYRQAFEYTQTYEQMLLHYVVDGAITVRSHSGDVTARRGDAVFTFPGDACTYRVHGPIQMIHSHIDLRGAGAEIIDRDAGGWVAEMDDEHSAADVLGARLILPDRIALDPAHEAVALLEQLAVEDTSGGVAGDLLRAGAGLRILALISRLATERLTQRQPTVRSVQATHVRHAIDIIEQRIAEQISLHDLARELGLDADYLGRLFRQSLGISAGTCILRHRLAQARKLLREPGRSIAVVAAAVGYPDALYFGRIFRRETGTTPSQWRRSQSLAPLSEMSRAASGAIG